MTSITPSPEMVERAKQSVLSEMSDRRLLNDVDDDLHDEIAAAIVQACLPALSCPDGFRLVPVEPTTGMLSAGESAASVGIGKCNDDESLPRVWRAMLAASPAPAVNNAGWRPIASAPTSGDILVFCEDTQEMFVAYHTRSIDTGEVGWTYARFRHHHGGIASVLCKPTHWQPLPSAPSQDAPQPISQDQDRG